MGLDAGSPTTPTQPTGKNFSPPSWYILNESRNYYSYSFSICFEVGLKDYHQFILRKTSRSAGE